MKDEIVNEVRKAREQQAAKWDYDLKSIIADARKRQKDSGREVVSLTAKTKKPA
jgi:hypothetical protein